MIGSGVGGVILGTGDKDITFNTLGATGGDKGFGVVFRSGILC